MSKSDLLKVLLERGYIHQCTDPEGLDHLLMEQQVTAYIGFDATAKSLHVGNLLQIMLLRTIQRTGHKPIVLMGGGTTKVGDPSGKDESRQILSEEEISANKAQIKKNFANFLNFGAESSDALVLDNDEWLSKLDYISFLRDYGKHFSINRMLSMDSVKLRLDREQPLTFLEFNYMILQAYDFVELNRRTGCRLQLGGSDQWGNIVTGIDLGRRVLQKELYGLTSPLITTSSGAKMGKTANGAIWLSPEMLSPYEYWQFWRNTEDSDVIRFLKLFTELSMQEIQKLEQLQGSEINEAKKTLAHHATSLCHGEEAALAAAQTAYGAFEKQEAADGLPTYHINTSEIASGIPIFKLFIVANLVDSGAASRRLIQGGGARIDGEPIHDEMMLITADHFVNGQIKLSAGKKQHALLKLT